MRQHLFAVVLLSVLGNSAWAAGSWVFQPSTYSHDPQTGERVEQYAAKPPVYGPSDPTYEQSAYIHKRTTLRGAGGSVERRHYVETWGEGEAIRPYGEWQRPFRAGATPYGPWGNPRGPWTSPEDSWVNPYGLGRLPTPPWSPWYPNSGYGGEAYPPYGGGPIAMPYGQSGQGGVPPAPVPGGYGGGPAGHPGGHGTAPAPSHGQGHPYAAPHAGPPGSG